MSLNLQAVPAPAAAEARRRSRYRGAGKGRKCRQRDVSEPHKPTAEELKVETPPAETKPAPEPLPSQLATAPEEAPHPAPAPSPPEIKAVAAEPRVETVPAKPKPAAEPEATQVVKSETVEETPVPAQAPSPPKIKQAAVEANAPKPKPTPVAETKAETEVRAETGFSRKAKGDRCSRGARRANRQAHEPWLRPRRRASCRRQNQFWPLRCECPRRDRSASSGSARRRQRHRCLQHRTRRRTAGRADRPLERQAGTRSGGDRHGAECRAFPAAASQASSPPSRSRSISADAARLVGKHYRSTPRGRGDSLVLRAKNGRKKQPIAAIDPKHVGRVSTNLN